MNKISIKDLSKAELQDLLKKVGAQSYRSDQIFRWLYRYGALTFDEMTDLAESLRKEFSAKCVISFHQAVESKRSALDQTTRFLFRLEDGNTIETVFLPEPRRNTICLSSQVGCKFGCDFCASAPFGFVRNLSTSEILDQVIFIKKKYPKAYITNLVFMGIGEPLDNYNNVLKAVRIFNDKDAFNIGARKITISTCGVIGGIERLIAERLQVELSVSLHSANDAVRSKILPVNRIYPLKDLIPACENYVNATNRIITFEYVLIDGVNCSGADARELVSLLKGIKCKVNAISYNAVPGKEHRAPFGRIASAFMKALADGGINAVHRKLKGGDIDAGCGQLRISRLKNEE